MKVKQAITEVNHELNKEIIFDIPRFVSDFNKLDVNIKNEDIKIIKKCLLERVTLKQYASNLGLAYSTIQKRKEQFKSLQSDGVRNHTVLKYEMCKSNEVSKSIDELYKELVDNDSLYRKLAIEANEQYISMKELIVHKLSK